LIFFFLSASNEKLSFEINVKRDDERKEDPISFCLKSKQDGVFLCMQGNRQTLYDLLSSARWAISRVDDKEYLHTTFEYDEFDLCMIPESEFELHQTTSSSVFSHTTEKITPPPSPKRDDDNDDQEDKKEKESTIPPKKEEPKLILLPKKEEQQQQPKPEIQVEKKKENALPRKEEQQQQQQQQTSRRFNDKSLWEEKVFLFSVALFVYSFFFQKKNHKRPRSPSPKRRHSPPPPRRYRSPSPPRYQYYRGNAKSTHDRMNHAAYWNQYYNHFQNMVPSMNRVSDHVSSANRYDEREARHIIVDKNGLPVVSFRQQQQQQQQQPVLYDHREFPIPKRAKI